MTGVLAALTGVGGNANLTVTATNVTAVSSGIEPSGLVVSAQTPNTQVTGVSGSVSYLWEYVSGSMVPAINSSTVQNPGWSAVVDNGVPEIAVWKVTATDESAATDVTEITVSLIWNSFS